MKNQIKPPGLPEVVMARAAENELYSELFWNQFTRKEIQVKWKLRNPKQICWPRKLQLVTSLTSPRAPRRKGRAKAKMSRDSAPLLRGGTGLEPALLRGASTTSQPRVFWH